jgi:hypothetical protein
METHERHGKEAAQVKPTALSSALGQSLTFSVASEPHNRTDTHSAAAMDDSVAAR